MPVVGRRTADFLQHSRFLDRVDLRLDPATAGWAIGKPSMRGLIQGWLRWRVTHEPDTTMPWSGPRRVPAVAFDLGLFGWTPTLEFTATSGVDPSRDGSGSSCPPTTSAVGSWRRTARVWDSAGNLVAQSAPAVRERCVRCPRAPLALASPVFPYAAGLGALDGESLPVRVLLRQFLA